MQTLVTHINPHLDDIVAIWLFKKFYPKFNGSKIEFISAGVDLSGEESEEKIFFGVGKGRFDEHKGDIGECATSLVWKDIVQNGLAPKDEIELKACVELVEWSRKVDLGQTDEEFDGFSMPAFIRPIDGTEVGSLRALSLGEEILDRIIEVLKRNKQSLQDFQEAREFPSTFGKFIAVKSETVNRAFCKKQDGDLFLMYSPKSNWVQYFTPKENINLEPLYLKLKKIDGEASWYLHHSNHFILCGANSSPDPKKTKLSFDNLIEVAASLG